VRVRALRPVGKSNENKGFIARSMTRKNNEKQYGNNAPVVRFQYYDTHKL
jgi:hypothetical protein